MKPILLFDVYVLLRHGERAGSELGGLERVCREELLGLLDTDRYEMVLCSSSGYEQPDCRDAFPALIRNMPELARCRILNPESISFVRRLCAAPLQLLTKLTVKAATSGGDICSSRLTAVALWLMDRFVERTAPRFEWPQEWQSRTILYYSVYRQFPAGLPRGKRIVRIATIHDLVPLRYPDECSPYGRLTFLWMIRRIVREADHLLMVSRFTREDVADFFRDLAVPTTVNWNGISQDFLEQAGQMAEGVSLPCGIPGNGRFFFTLAAAGKRKNLVFLSRCFLKFIQDSGFNDLYLVIGGNIAKTSPELQDLIRSSGGKLIAPGYISEADLPVFYHHAAGYLFVSRSEGFGLPLLEAMAARTPIIAARAGSLPEIAGDAAIYVDPDDKDAVIQAMRRLLTEPELRRELIGNGERRVRKFLWPEHIRRMTACFDTMGQIGA